VSGHLGPLAAALVDDQLDPSSREKALRHVAACESCRFEVEQQRTMKARLDRMGEPELPSALLDRLSALRPPEQPAADEGARGRTPGPTEWRGLPASPPGSPFGAGSAGRGPWSPAALIGTQRPVARTRVRRVLVGATSLVLLGGGAAYAAGGGSGSGAPPVRPPVDVYTVQHGTTSQTVPLNDPAVSAVTAGFGR
jgi:anti-sigma factor RsiW